MNTLKKLKQYRKFISNKTKRKSIKPEYQNQTTIQHQSYQINKYEIHVLSQSEYNNEEEEQKNQRQQIESFLETILEQEENQIEQKLQELNGNHQNNSLENIIKENENEKYIISKKYNNKIPNSQNLNNYTTHLNSQASSHRINPESGAHVFYVPSSSLPPNVLGMYLPDLHVYYVSNDLPQEQMQWVDFHEEYHSKYGAGEAQADAYATRKLGHNPFTPRQHTSAA